jgi:hypothetical protein
MLYPTGTVLNQPQDNTAAEKVRPVGKKKT